MLCKQKKGPGLTFNRRILCTIEPFSKKWGYICFCLKTFVADGVAMKPITPPAPLVAKVLTNAAGQVISVESLLAHQKQHGTLPQGT